MSTVTAARRNGRLVLIIGLTREDVDQLIGGSVVFLEAKWAGLPDIALLAGETEADLEAYLKEMENGPA